MKEKIASALRTKYQRFGLSNEAIDRIASAKEKTVKEGDDIDLVIADAETMELIANELQKSADAERRNRSTIQKSFDEYKKLHPEVVKTDPKPEDEEPEWAKKLREQNEALVARLDQADKAKKDEAVFASVKKKLEEAGCSNPGILSLTMRGFAIGENESEDEAVARVTSEYNANIKATFGDGPVPPAGSKRAFSGDPKAAAESKNEFLRERGLIPNTTK